MHKKHSGQLSLFQKARDVPRWHIRVATYTGESYVVRFLLAALIFCTALYLYFVGISILNVIANTQAGVDSARLQSTVGSLEQEYFKLSNAVTPQTGVQLGLAKTSASNFVRRSNGMATNIRTNDL